MTIETVSENRSFGGVQGVYSHRAPVVGCDMTFSVYLPPAAGKGKVPVLWWLSGLTCTQENFTTKAGAQRYAAETGIAIVCPDTSPRDSDHPGEHDTYDFGSAAGFYLDATQAPWSENYRMYSYITEALPADLFAAFPLDSSRQSISGHSMGGHGALTIGIRNPETYRSVSAFSPIVAPSQVPWGEKALGGYLGADRAAWRKHDACALIEDLGYDRPLLVEQGLADNFLAEQLRPELLEDACKAAGVPLTVNRREGYDHSYYFIASFIGDHIGWHAERLKS
jgi:S-formylglutathione hydrolase